MSYLLELLGRGLGGDLAETLDRYFWTAGAVSVEELKSQAAEHPNYPDVQCRLGMAYLRAARCDKAAEHLALACKHKPDFLAARLALAAAREEAGQLDLALEQVDVACQTHPGEAAILFCKGYLLEKLDRSAEAPAYYRDAIEAAPDMIGARQRLAAIALFNDDLDEAIEQYTYMAEDDPGDCRLRQTLAQLLYRSGAHGDAVRQYESAIAMEPENWALADEQVEALVADGQIRDAIERLDELIVEQGDFPDLHVRIADLYSQVSDDDRAMWHYRRALDAQPDYLEAHVKVGTHHLINGRWGEASEAFAEAVELNDQLLTAYIGLGVAHQAQGECVAAMSSFDLAAAVDPNSTLLVRETSRLQLKCALQTHAAQQEHDPADSQTAAAALQSEDLLKLQLRCHGEHVVREQGHADVHYRYGVLLRAEGRLTEAIEQFDRAIELNHTYTQAIIKRGLTLQDLGRVEEAADAFGEAMDVKPEYVDLHYNLALLHTDGRRFNETVREMEAAPGGEHVRANLAVALQNMGLMDRVAATWRSLRKTFKTGVEMSRKP